MEDDSTAAPEVTSVDDKLVNEAVLKIKEIFSKHNETDQTKIGEYLFEKFYNNDIELLRKKTPVLSKKKSFNMVFQRLKEEDPRLPGKSWAYNLVKVKVQDHDFQDDDEFFQTYGKLSLGQKTELLKVSDLDEKRELVREVYESNLSVRGLINKIAELYPRKARQSKPVAFPKYIKNIRAKIEEWKTLFGQYTEMGKIQEDVDKVKYKIQELEEVIKNIKT